MTLQQLSNKELLENTHQAVARERTQTAIVLELLEEVSRRMLFAELGYPSLFAFVQKELGYSEDQAQVRISAMRLAREIPEVKPAIESGRLSITNLSQVQTFLRQEKKAGKSYDSGAKQELVMQMQGLSKRECERKLLAVSPEHARQDSARAISESETRLTVVLNAPTMAALERIRALWGNRDLSYAELIEKMTRVVLEKIDPEEKEKRRQKRGEEKHAADSGPAQVIEPLKQRTRYIPAAVRAEVRKRDGGSCTCVDPTTGRRCGATYALQWDHIIPFAQGGSNQTDNLRIRCRMHNRLYAVQVYGKGAVKG